MKRYNIALTIAGSDPSGGAGIQADLKTFSACGCYGASIITAVVDENTQGVFGVHSIPEKFVAGQMRSVLDDLGVDAIKIGMLHTSQLVLEVASVLKEYKVDKIVLDPVMVATSGDRLLEKDAVDTIVEHLIPLVKVITPNIPEAEIFLGRKITNQQELFDVVKELSFGGQVSVLLKAGHLHSDEIIDVFYNAESGEVLEFKKNKINTKNTHGTGCTLSSAVAAYWAKGLSLNEAIQKANDYIHNAILSGSEYSIGKGNGPVNHFFVDHKVCK